MYVLVCAISFLAFFVVGYYPPAIKMVSAGGLLPYFRDLAAWTKLWWFTDPSSWALSTHKKQTQRIDIVRAGGCKKQNFEFRTVTDLAFNILSTCSCASGGMALLGMVFVNPCLRTSASEGSPSRSICVSVCNELCTFYISSNWY